MCLDCLIELTNADWQLIGDDIDRLTCYHYISADILHLQTIDRHQDHGGDRRLGQKGTILYFIV